LTKAKVQMWISKF